MDTNTRSHRIDGRTHVILGAQLRQAVESYAARTDRKVTAVIKRALIEYLAKVEDHRP